MRWPTNASVCSCDIMMSEGVKEEQGRSKNDHMEESYLTISWNQYRL